MIGNSTEITEKDILVTCLAVTFGSGAIAGNSIILLVFYKFKNMRDNDCIYLICCLAMADLLTGGIWALYLHTTSAEVEYSR